MLGARRRDLQQSRSACTRGWWVLAEANRADMRRHVYVQRNAVWPVVPDPFWRRYREEVIMLSSSMFGLPYREKVRIQKLAVILELKLLKDQCADCQVSITWLLQSIGNVPSGARLVGTASAVAAAFCRTLYAYGVKCGDIDDEMGPPTEELSLWHHYGTLFHACAEASGRLLTEEVRAMFCLNLRYIARELYLHDIAWNWIPPADEFVPAWCFENKGDGGVLRIRPRVSKNLPERLIRRYRNRILASRS